MPPHRERRPQAGPMAMALAFMVLGAAAPGRAVEVQPLVHELGVTGPPASTRILVTNPSDRPLPIEIAVSRLVFDGAGVQRQEPSYYATLSQVPVALPEDGASGLRFLLAFNVVLHVSPQGAEPRITVLDTRIETGQGATPVLVARLANQGRRYTFVGQHVLSLASGTTRLVLAPEDIRERKLDVFLPPGVTRIIRIPLDEGNWAEPVRVDLRLEEAD